MVNLAEMASSAATSIDDHLVGRNGTDYGPINNLSEFLGKMTFQIEKKDFSKIDFFDAVLGAYREYPNGLYTGSDEVSDFARGIEWISQELGHVREISDERLEDIRAFCVDLSIRANSYELRQNFINEDSLGVKC